MLAWATKRRAAETRDWYWAASPEDRKEYDAFGPWVDPVRSEAEMPRCFRDAYKMHRDARFLLKVPIDADRLSVRPGMDLYRMIMAVHDDRLSLLRLVEGTFTTETIGWEDVAAIRSLINLLAASWSLLTRDGETITVDYNTVAFRRFDAVTDFIRDKLTPTADRPNDRQQGATVAVADLFFQNMLFAVRNSVPRPVMPLHFEARDRFCRDDANRRRLSTGLLIVDAGEELVIVDRGAPVRRIFHPTYAACTTFVPYKPLTGFALVSPPDDRGRFHRLMLRIDRQTIAVSCLNVPERVVACLADRGIPQTAA